LKRRNCLFVLIFILITGLTWEFGFSAFASGETDDKVSIEGLFDREFQVSLSTPQFKWLQDGSALLMNWRVEPGKRTLERLDPKTGKQKKAVNAEAVLEALKKELGSTSPKALPWPDAISPEGKYAAYLLDGDIFLVELEPARVQRLTQTRQNETAISFSPDSQWIAFIRGNDIYAVRRAVGEEKRLTTDGTDTLLNGALSWVYWEEIYNHTTVPYHWSPDSKAVAYLQSDESHVQISTFVNFKPATQEVVRQRYPKAGQRNPEVRLGIVDIASAQTTWLDCGEYEYLARFNWLPDSSALAVQTLNRKQSHLKFFLADRKTGTSKLILEEKDNAWINLNDPLYFFKSKPLFIWPSERDDQCHLYLYGLDGKLKRQLTSGTFSVVSAGGGLLSGAGGLVGVDEKKGLVYFTANEKALRERHLYRVKIDGKGLTRLSEGAGTHVVSFSPDMSCYLEVYSNSARSGELSLYKADGRLISVIVPYAKEALAPWELAAPEFDTYKAEDGLDIPIEVFKPTQVDEIKKYPAIIYVYGGPVAQQVVDTWNGRKALWTNLLNREGYFVFVVEVRAGAGISKSVTTSVYRQAYGMPNVRDIQAALRWIKRKPNVDAKRIGIWGGSGGGCTTIFTMTRVEDFKAGISLFPVSDWYYYDTIYTERFLDTPQDNPDGYRDTSAVLGASGLSGRLLIVHGTYDDNVHPQNTWAFINELITFNIQFDLMIYPWRKHGITDLEARVHLYTMMMDFWKKNL
jgi:dipeptidyl-peptidase-4